MNATQTFPEPGTALGRAITLAFLSKRLPASLLGEQVAQSLCAETGMSVALVRLDNNAPADLIPGEGVRLSPRQPESEACFQLLTVGMSNGPHPAGWIASLVEQLRHHFFYTLFEINTEQLPAPSLFEFLRCTEPGFLFLQPVAEDIYQMDLLTRELRSQSDDHNAQIEPVLCLADGEAVAGYDNLIQNVGSTVQTFIRGCPNRKDGDAGAAQINPKSSFRTDIRRLARKIGSCLVGLALSSGAAKGLSHIGVIQVLEENGIDVDVIAGSSMGAYMGSIWACGFDGPKLEALARELESCWAMLRLIDPAIPPRQGFLRGFAIKRRLKKSIGDIRFAELLRPLRVVATNLETLERTVFCSGEVAAAVHASVAVPGICVPVTLGGEIYVDGGIVDPLPVDILREMGVGRVIAVNAIPTPDRIRYSRQAERELGNVSKAPAREVIRKLAPVDEHLNYFARGNILEILMRSIHGAQGRMAESLGRQADIVLRPEICDDRWVDFRSPGKYIALGRKIAERHLEEIKTLVGKKAGPYERHPTLSSLARAA